jgi:hypothetical protein
MTTEIQDILVEISQESQIKRKVQPLGSKNADNAFLTKKMGFNLLIKYYDSVTDTEIPNLIAPYEMALLIDNDTLVNPDGSYADVDAVLGEDGVIGEFDWLITMFQVGGLNFETFFPFVILRADVVGRFNRI